MNYLRLALAAVAAFVAYMGVGGVFFMFEGLKAEFAKHSSVFRSGDAMKGAVMGVGMLGMLLAMVAAAALFAKIHPAGADWMAGLKFGGVMAAFVLGSYVLHNYMNLQISRRLAALQAVIHTLQWIVVGVVIALVYRP